MCCCPWVVVLGEVRPEDPVTLAWADGLKCRSSSGQTRVGDAQDRAVAGRSIGGPSSLDLGPVGHAAAFETQGLQPLLLWPRESWYACLLPIVGPFGEWHEHLDVTTSPGPQAH